jgi:hypothetical protein
VTNLSVGAVLVRAAWFAVLVFTAYWVFILWRLYRGRGRL